jgi:hypothetical protein
MMTGWNFMYELFMSGVAGRLKVLYPMEGLRIFSSMMVINTIICAALAVIAARMLSRVVPSLIAGAMLTTTGIIVAVCGFHSIPRLFVAILFLTLGEVVYGALGQFLLIRSVPALRRENTVYSTAILVANFGRMTAAGLAFPLIVRANTPWAAAWTAAGVGLASILILLAGMKQLTEVAEDRRVVVS